MWGTENDYLGGVVGGTVMVDSSGNPIKAKEIDVIVGHDIYANGYGRYTCVYRDCAVPGVTRSHTFEANAYDENGYRQSFYIAEDSGSYCLSTSDQHEPVQGLIIGCKETDMGGTLHWGDAADAFDPTITNDMGLKDPSTGELITCKGISYVYSTDSVPAADGNGETGIWNIVYVKMNGERAVVSQYGTSGPSGPEGAFTKPNPGSSCIDNAFNIITTRDVIMVNSPEIATRFSRILGQPPLGNSQEIIIGGVKYNYGVQEDFNIIDAELMAILQKRKPTVNVTTDITSVEKYLPERGDLWIDPTNYTLYCCDINVDAIDPDSDEFREDPFAYTIWVELGAAAGDVSGNNVTISLNPPNDPAKGDLWVEENTYHLFVWDGDTWNALTGDQSAVIDNKFEVYMNSVPPLGQPKLGDLWFDTQIAEMRIFHLPGSEYDSNGDLIPNSNTPVWVPVTGTGYKSAPTTAPPFAIDEDGELTVEGKKIVDKELVNQMQEQIDMLMARMTQLEQES